MKETDFHAYTINYIKLILDKCQIAGNLLCNADFDEAMQKAQISYANAKVILSVQTVAQALYQVKKAAQLAIKLIEDIKQRNLIIRTLEKILQNIEATEKQEVTQPLPDFLWSQLIKINQILGLLLPEFQTNDQLQIQLNRLIMAYNDQLETTNEVIKSEDMIKCESIKSALGNLMKQTIELGNIALKIVSQI